MDFDFDDDQRAIQEVARDLLTARAPDDDRLWDELVELGWAGIAVPSEFGGQGLGMVELALLAEEMGYACAESPFLGTVLAAIGIDIAGSVEQRERWLPQLAAGSVAGALALGTEGEVVPDATPDGVLVIPAVENGRGVLADAAGIEPIETIDPRRRHGRLVEIPAGEELAGDGLPARQRAAIVVAAELTGICRRALDLTVAYVKERRQFDVPVGSFQAVQHAAAQMLRETEVASVATYYAAWTADAAVEGLAEASAMAKAAASDAGRAVTAAAIQLHGGIGFTWEGDVHWLYKRAQVDSFYLGGGGAHRAALVGALADRP